MFYNSHFGHADYYGRGYPYHRRRHRYNYHRPGRNYYDSYDCYDYPYWNYPCNNYYYR